jgi:lipopolysaccharide/colanic/teichoic acid biosynthesis glycosyltransferase
MLKTVLERLFGGAALVACSPILGLATVAIALESGLPVLFRQERVGKNGRIFPLLKLRSMRSNQKGLLITAAGDTRVTRVGAFLRKYKIDELPQFWNIVAGHMQFIGPRPELPVLVNDRNPLWREVLAVKPGLADVATLVYRNEEEILSCRTDPEAAYRQEILPEKLALSVAYQRTRNAWTDFRLLLLSVRYSFFPEGFEPETIRRTFVETE